MDALVGHTGFVGSNLLRQHDFAARFNSANLAGIAGRSFDTLVVSSAPAAMWQANQAPEADWAGLEAQLALIGRARARRVVLISTIAVLRDPAAGPDETSTDYEEATPYGRHRRAFEEAIAARFPTHLILRLPALFGHGLKKNFLFDLRNPVPTFLRPEAWDELQGRLPAAEAELLSRAFRRDGETGLWLFDRAGHGAGETGARIAAILGAAGISTIAFTHADSRFQFYPLARLWSDIETAFAGGLSVLNLATEPLTAGEVHRAVLGREMTARSAARITQDMRTRHAALWGREGPYLAGRAEILEAIGRFMAEGAA